MKTGTVVGICIKTFLKQRKHKNYETGRLCLNFQIAKSRKKFQLADLINLEIPVTVYLLRTFIADQYGLQSQFLGYEKMKMSVKKGITFT